MPRVKKTEVIKRGLGASLTECQPGPSPYELGVDLFGADKGPETDFSSRFKTLLKHKLRGKDRR